MLYTVHFNFGIVLADGEVKTATMEFKDCKKLFTKESYEKLTQLVALQVEQLTGKEVIKITPLSDEDVEKADNKEDYCIQFGSNQK